MVNLDGVVEVNVIWESGFEESLDRLTDPPVARLESNSDIKFSIPFDALALHFDHENPATIPFNNPDLENTLEETYQNIVFVLLKRAKIS